jgi:LSD1 subclass zinc finger protein
LIGGTRKKLPLDVIVDNEPSQLLKGYSTDQLNEIFDKIQDLEGELSRLLDYGEVQEIIGAKMDKQTMWFYVRWDDNECSFIPAQVLNRMAPDKVIQYYEGILQFQPAPENKDSIRGTDRLLKSLGSSGGLVDRQVKDEIRQNKPHHPPPQQQNKPTGPTRPPQPKPPQAGGPFRTMNCTGCNILLQYPEGTKAIKCPVCNTVMQALYS